MTPKLAKCLVGTKINLPSLSSPPLASVPSVLALISSPRDESLGSWGGRLCRAQLSFDSCPEPYRHHCVHMCGCVLLHVREALRHCCCDEHRDNFACCFKAMHVRVSAHKHIWWLVHLSLCVTVCVCECLPVVCGCDSKCQEMRRSFWANKHKFPNNCSHLS